jgi:translocation and assembly module TamB
VVQDLRGRYEYTGTDHELKVSSLRFAQGAYQAQLKLQGAAPMALQAEATGDVQVPNPLDKSDDALNTIAVQARVTAEGTLATEAARLEIKANASAETSGSGAELKTRSSEPKLKGNRSPQARSPQQQMGPMQADVEASIMPWRSQPLLAAKASSAISMSRHSGLKDRAPC